MATFAGRYDAPLLRRSSNEPNALVRAMTGGQATVYESDGETLATLYSGRDKLATVANPVVVDSEGNLEFFAEPGTYVLAIEDGGSVVRTDTVIVPFDPAETDSSVEKTDGLPVPSSVASGLVYTSNGSTVSGQRPVSEHALEALAGATDGVTSTSGLQVTAGSGLTVNVAAGTAVVSAAGGGKRLARLSGSTSVTLDAADPTNPRVDLVVVSASGSQSGGVDSASVSKVTGTPAGSPVAPAVPANSVALAEVRVNAGQTSLTAGSITDRRSLRFITPAPSTLDDFRGLLRADPAAAKIVLLGDSTSFEANAVNLYPRFRDVHMKEGQALAGMQSANLINGGNNGLSLEGWLASSGGTYSRADLEADYPDLCVFSFGINDVRTGATTQAQLEARMRRALDYFEAALPRMAVILRMPNSLTSTVVGQNFLTGITAQDATDILRRAYQTIAGEYPRCVLFDAQGTIFGDTARSTSILMADQLHPNGEGYRAIADGIAATIRPPARYGDRAAEAARDTDFQSPWVFYRNALDDPEHWTLVAEGRLTGFTTTTFAFSYLGIYAKNVLKYDVVRIGDATPFVLNAGMTSALQATGDPEGQTFISNVTSGLIPQDQSVGARVRVYRRRYASIAFQQLIREQNVHRFIKEGWCTGGGVSFIDFESRNPTDPSSQWAVYPGDTIHVDGAASVVIPTSASLFQTGNNFRVTNLGNGVDYSTLVGRQVVITGSHPNATTGTKAIGVSLDFPSIAAGGTAELTAAVTGARRQLGVVAAPRGAPEAGLMWSAYCADTNDQVVLRMHNTTASPIDPAARQWDFFVVR